jgi:photosystem II stability/assembly factor-like uncharacterized protein
MSAAVPPLGIEVDPLIAEAKRRARRRRAAWLLLVVAGGTALGLYLSRPGGGSNGGGNTSAVPSSISMPPVAGTGFVQAPSAAALARETLVAMSFPTARVGYLVRGDGALLRSVDEGRSWREVGRLRVSRLSYRPPRLDFVTPRDGFALTFDGRLLETADAGSRWRFVRRLRAISTLDFLDPSDGWVATTSGAIYRTADGGRSWTRLASPHCFAFAGLSFITTTSGFAVCSGQGGAGQAGKDLYETSDGGHTWQHIAATRFPGSSHRLPDIPASGYADGVLFRSPSSGVMSAHRAGLYLTRDAGRTWSLPLLTDDAWSVSAMSWPSADVAYALIIGGDGDALLRSTDGARHWRAVYPNGPGSPGATVAALSPRTVLGAGTGTFGVREGTLVATTDGGRTWTTAASLPGQVEQVVRGGGSVWAVSLTREATSSPVDLLFRSRDEGRTWTRVATPPHLGITWLDVAPDGSVFLSTWHGGLYRSGDDGRSWQTIRRRGQLLGTVQFVSAQAGFAIVRQGTFGEAGLVETVDGGKTWQRLATAGLNPFDLYVLNPRDWWLWGFSSCHVRVLVPATKRPPFPGKRGCVGAVHKVLLRTSDGGAHWTAFRMASVLETPGYSFLTPRLGYATSEDGILRTSDGGQTWRWVPSKALPVKR